MVVVDRKSNKKYEYKSSGFVSFLYNNFIGRFILKLLCNRFIANFVALFMNSSLSRFMIKRKIKSAEIDMSLYENKKYKCFNEFFTRKLVNISFDDNKNSFISPCDSKLLILKLDKNLKFNIKGSSYNAFEVIENDIVKDFYNGYVLVFRLDVNDYHHYCYVDDGYRDGFHYIKGILHTVQPIVYDKVNVFHRNCREWCVLHTNNFSDIIQCEIGAMLVGKICNDQNVIEFNKGDEKGHFEFGGSTVVLFVKENVVDFDKDIMNNSKVGRETIVKYGEKIGIKK